MSKPIVVVISQNQMMASELPGLFQGDAEICACVTVEEFIELAKKHEPGALLADFRRASDSGDEEVRAIETVRVRHPNIHIAMVTPIDCPENLARYALATAITHLRGHLDREALLKAFGPLFHPKPFVFDDSRNPALASLVPFPMKEMEPPLIALTGSSRRYETWSPDFCQTLSDLESAAAHDVTVCLVGESGSGVTHLARLIHEISPRRYEPFLTIACGALPNEQFDRELFGEFEEVSFGERQGRQGKLLEACRGTILLDEIETLGLQQQVRLLRVLESGEFVPAGSQLTHCNQSRLILARRLALQPLVALGRFKPELYYRLTMMSFVVPPLRHRKNDIAPLANKFVRQFAFKHGISISRIDTGLFDVLLNYPWPGNLRELEQVIERAVILCRDGQLQSSHLPSHLMFNPTDTGNSAQFNPGTPVNSLVLNEKEIIEQTLFQNRFRRTNTATQLGISPMSLYHKMKKYGLRNG